MHKANRPSVASRARCRQRAYAGQRGVLPRRERAHRVRRRLPGSRHPAERPRRRRSCVLAGRQANSGRRGSEDDCGYGLGPDLSDIYLANPRGKHQWRLTNTYGSSDPDWSPDGRKLAFSRNRTLDRSDVLRSDDSLRAADEMCKLGAPAHREVEAGSESDVYVIGADGRGMRRLIRNPLAGLVSRRHADRVRPRGMDLPGRRGRIRPSPAHQGHEAYLAAAQMTPERVSA